MIWNFTIKWTLFITWDFRRCFVGSKFVSGFAFVDTVNWLVDTSQNNGMPVAPMGENSLFSLENLPIFEPDHFSFGWGVNSANNFCFFIFGCVDEGLLGFDFRGVWKI